MAKNDLPVVKLSPHNRSRSFASTDQHRVVIISPETIRKTKQASGRALNARIRKATEELNRKLRIRGLPEVATPVFPVHLTAAGIERGTKIQRVAERIQEEARTRGEVILTWKAEQMASEHLRKGGR